MARIKDRLTLDMFEVPRAAPTTPGSMAFSREIAAVMSDALKKYPYDRPDVAARMTRLSGREMTLSMLNAYTAESRETHNISLERAIVFDVATEGHALLDFYAGKLGGQVLWGKETLQAELGRLQIMEADIKRQKQAIKEHLGRGRK